MATIDWHSPRRFGSLYDLVMQYIEVEKIIAEIKKKNPDMNIGQAQLLLQNIRNDLLWHLPDGEHHIEGAVVTVECADTPEFRRTITIKKE